MAMNQRRTDNFGVEAVLCTTNTDTLCRYMRGSFSTEQEMVRSILRWNSSFGDAIATYRLHFDGSPRMQWSAMNRIINIFETAMTRKTVLMRSTLFPNMTFSSDVNGANDEGDTTTKVGFNFLRMMPIPM